MSPFSWKRHPRDDLSAHADGQLAPERAAEVERHLGSCDACRAEFTDLVAMRTALSSLPEIPAPRSFALTPEQARGPARVYQAPTGRTQLVKGLRLGSAGLAMALVAVMLLDGSGGGGSTGGDDAALELETASQEYRASDGDEAEADSTASLLAPPTASPMATPDPGGTTAGGSGSTTGGGSSGGVGGVGSAEPSPVTEAPAADASVGITTAPTDAPPEPTAAQEEALRATEDEFASSGADDSDTPDTEDESASADTAPDDDDGDDGLLALEILLALGAAGALIASVFVARAARRDPSGN